VLPERKNGGDVSARLFADQNSGERKGEKPGLWEQKVLISLHLFHRHARESGHLRFLEGKQRFPLARE
jgi:hypothetical protein